MLHAEGRGQLLAQVLRTGLPRGRASACALVCLQAGTEADQHVLEQEADTMPMIVCPA